MEIADRWALRYYEWSLEKSEHEFRMGFPLLSLVLGRAVFKFLEYAHSLTEEDRSLLRLALVKRSNTRAMEIRGETLDVYETRLIDGYINYDKRINARGEVTMLPYGSERERAFVDRGSDHAVRKPSRAAIRRIVCQRLNTIFGQPNTKPSGTTTYQIRSSNWQVRTIIDYGGNFGQITYAHVLIPDGQNPVQPPIHLCGWMGIAGQTKWDLYHQGQASEVADALVTLVSSFHNDWPSVVVGLI